MNFLNSITIADLKSFFETLGTLSSLLSLIISIFVLISLKKIRQFYLFNAKAPEATKKLSKLASALSNSLDSFDGISTKIHEILIDIEISLVSLKKIFNDDIKNINSLISSIQKIDKNNKKSIFKDIFKKKQNMEEISTQKEFLENIHLSIYKILASCKESYEEARWER